MKRIIKTILIFALIALVGIQLIRPEKNQAGYQSVAAFETETKITAEVAGIFKANCYDCHSNHTAYPWYAEIAPISIWLDEHIEHGKEHFNVSEWETYSAKKKAHKLEELIEEVKAGEMPLNSYTWVHGNLTNTEKETLLRWADIIRLQYLNN